MTRRRGEEKTTPRPRFKVRTWGNHKVKGKEKSRSLRCVQNDKKERRRKDNPKTQVQSTNLGHPQSQRQKQIPRDARNDGPGSGEKESKTHVQVRHVEYQPQRKPRPRFKIRTWGTLNTKTKSKVKTRTCRNSANREISAPRKSGTGIRGVRSDSRLLTRGGRWDVGARGYSRVATKMMSRGVSFLASCFSMGDVRSWRPLVFPMVHTWERK
jgi:hypothetical protein